MAAATKITLFWKFKRSSSHTILYYSARYGYQLSLCGLLDRVTYKRITRYGRYTYGQFRSTWLPVKFNSPFIGTDLAKYETKFYAISVEFYFLVKSRRIIPNNWTISVSGRYEKTTFVGLFLNSNDASNVLSANNQLRHIRSENSPWVFEKSIFLRRLT